MKKLFLLLLGVALCVPAFAATTLTDREMGSIYATSVDVELNTIEATNSAAAAQTNMGAIVGGGPVTEVDVLNSNAALVINLDGDSAVALQNNIGAIASLGELVADARVINTNRALVLNTYEPNGTATIDGRSVGVASDAVNLLINDVLLGESAAAAQNNIGAIFGGAGVTNAQVVNNNCAIVGNLTNDAGMFIVEAIHAHVD